MQVNRGEDISNAELNNMNSLILIMLALISIWE